MTYTDLTPYQENDSQFFASLPSAVRAEVRLWREALSTAVKPLEKSFARIAVQMGVKQVTVRRRYYAWKNSGGDWKSLLDTRKCSKLWRTDQAGLPEEFKTWWLGFQLRYQRDTTGRKAHSDLIAMWRRKEPIKGYEDKEFQIDPMTGLPVGWSYTNLKRFKPNKWQTVSIRQGRQEAIKYLPPVLSTRVGLKTGQVVMFDDQDYDVLVNFLGVNRKLTRPSGFDVIDVLTGYNIMDGYKPTILNDDGSKEKLKQVDFEWFLINYLTTVGYRADTGSLFIIERGTTKTSKEFAQRVMEATNHKVSFDASGVHRDPAMAGMLKGSGRGNPQFKALRESWFNLLRNEQSAIPGATGKDWDHAPLTLNALKQENKVFLDIYAALSKTDPERAKNLLAPVLNWNDFIWATRNIKEGINARTQHEMEGWVECGFIAHEWRLQLESEDWLPMSQFLALPPAEQALAAALIQTRPGLQRTQRLSPHQAWCRGANELTRVEGHYIPILLGPEFARQERVEKDQIFVIKDQEIEPDDMAFLAILHNGTELKRGQHYKVFLNPFNTRSVEVCAQDGSWLGSAKRWHSNATKADAAGLRRAYAEVASIEAQAGHELAVLGRDITKDEIERRLKNAELLSAANKARKSGGKVTDADLQNFSGAIGSSDYETSTPAEQPLRGVSDDELSKF